MDWLFLFFAGILEIVWAYFMKQSLGFTKIIPSILTILTMVASFTLLSISMKSIPLGTAYIIWTGIGAVGAFLIGIFFMGEAANALRFTAATLIISGLILIKLS
ncbi:MULTISPECIES: DMT family transporter [Legionella]|uniref:Guanidinium exporter n=1 Tax=Legionella steelei TaxID=947033 RepID=A0A0W0ZPY9_9GAMM|nr:MULTISPECIES: multidrug efflux SMR transporter [Legionella]KTD71080.1 multidrug efflux system protein [Legionella steelei]MBN9225885.1 multidrug efflux SMR transporter [Legionella steelei]OJW07859.1 MAG: QacE family quaternary ammonium compound efflux SMR transporter [Legionella sp. 39-23]